MVQELSSLFEVYLRKWFWCSSLSLHMVLLLLFFPVLMVFLYFPLLSGASPLCDPGPLSPYRLCALSSIFCSSHASPGSVILVLLFFSVILMLFILNVLVLFLLSVVLV